MDGVDLLIRKLEARDEVSDAERAALRAAAGPDEVFDPRADVVVQGERQTASRLLVSGMVARIKVLEDGRRQITEVHVPGDFVDLHSLLLKRLDHDIAAIGPARLTRFSHEALRRITEAHPHLTRLLWMATLIDAAVHREWLVAAGRKSALEQVAGLFCELLVRNQVVGLAPGDSYAFPPIQTDLADACGLSSVHINRVVQELREMRLISWANGRVTVHDYPRLAELGRFDPAFLILRREPR